LKAFRFNLNAALHWRETQLQLEEEKLSRLLLELEQLQSRCADNERARSTASKSQLESRSHSGSDFAALAAYLVGLDLAADRLRAESNKIQQRVKEQQTSCIAAKRAVKLLDLLKEKRRKTWQHEVDVALETAATESHLARRVRTDS
jgi:flagellar export protein FliJ